MKVRRPIIGLTPQLDITNDFRHVRLFPQYQRSIEKAGGIGIMLPLTEDVNIMKDLADLCDGFLFTGGQDLQPELYGKDEDKNLEHATGYAPERDVFESLFYPIVRNTQKPILAICRGFQIINVLHGGTIVQELKEKDGYQAHSPKDRDSLIIHDIVLTPGTKLQNIYDRPRIFVNSFHHQGLGILGDGLTASGKTADGLIEAFDIDGMDFGVAVQWHPEVMYDSGLDEGKLFHSFIKACKRDMHRRKKRKTVSHDDPLLLYKTKAS